MQRLRHLLGHALCVAIELEDLAPATLRLKELMATRLGLPSAPKQPIVVREERDRPQPVRDRMAGNGMSVVVGRVRDDPVLGMKFVVLGHNTIRGAAGAAILNAELLIARGQL